MNLLLLFSLLSSFIINIKDNGAVPDGQTLNTVAIQKAIDKASRHKGGGTVYVGPGIWLTGMLQLKDNVQLRLHPDAVLLGSTNPYDYDANQTTASGITITSFEDVPQALIITSHAKNVSITGQGTVDGQGLALALAIDSLHHVGQRVDQNYNTRRSRPSTRPKLLYLADTEGIELRGVKFRNSAGWGLSLHQSTNITIDSVSVYNRAYWNNDGIDINDCHDVKVSHCDINSADDGICLKSDSPNDMCHDVHIQHCRIASSASAVKFGSSSFGGFRDITIRDITVYDTFRSAIAIESVDGGTIDNVLVDGVYATNTGNPLFIRLGARHGIDTEGKTVEGVCSGTCRNITIRNLKAEVPFDRPDKAYDLRGPEVDYFHNPWPSPIVGLPDHCIENVTLENIDILYPGRATKGMAYIGLYRASSVPEVPDKYPEFSMFGELPSWAFYVRHVRNITFRNVNVRLADTDFRPAILFDDVQGQVLSQVSLPDDMIYEVK